MVRTWYRVNISIPSCKTPGAAGALQSHKWRGLALDISPPEAVGCRLSIEGWTRSKNLRFWRLINKKKNVNQQSNLRFHVLFLNLKCAISKPRYMIKISFMKLHRATNRSRCGCYCNHWPERVVCQQAPARTTLKIGQVQNGETLAKWFINEWFSPFNHATIYESISQLHKNYYLQVRWMSKSSWILGNQLGFCHQLWLSPMIMMSANCFISFVWSRLARTIKI